MYNKCAGLSLSVSRAPFKALCSFLLFTFVPNYRALSLSLSLSSWQLLPSLDTYTRDFMHLCVRVYVCVLIACQIRVGYCVELKLS